jgi:hypothetical protein
MLREGEVDDWVGEAVRDASLPLIPKREMKFRQTLEKMEGFSFVTPVTGLNGPNTGKEDDDDDELP